VETAVVINHSKYLEKKRIEMGGRGEKKNCEKSVMLTGLFRY
jgi:hypothetical protein